MNAWLIVFQFTSLMMMIAQGAALLWIAFMLKSQPQTAVNVRSILGAIEGNTAVLAARVTEARARIESIGHSQQMDNEAIKKALFGIVEMIDVYVLRISIGSRLEKRA
jgi:hypothetical protein